MRIALLLCAACAGSRTITRDNPRAYALAAGPSFYVRFDYRGTPGGAVLFELDADGRVMQVPAQDSCASDLRADPKPGFDCVAEYIHEGNARPVTLAISALRDARIEGELETRPYKPLP